MTTEELQQESSLADDLAANVSYDDESPEVEATDEAPEAEAVAEAIEEAIEALEPPPKWDRRYKEVFSSWTASGEDGNPMYPNGREWQEAMLELYNSNQSYATKVEQERAEAKKKAEQYENYLRQISGVVSPYQQFLNESGMTPDLAMRQGLGLLQSLKQDPKSTMLRLAREHNVDLQSALSEQPWQSPESKEIETLKQKLAEFERNSLRTQQEQAAARMQASRAETAKQINAFAEAKDESGNLKHPYLETVQEQMATLIYGREQMRQTNPNMPKMGLDEAYEAACKLNPEVAQAEAERSEKARLAQKDAEAKKAVSAAKHVKSGSAGKEKSQKSLRETIRENIVAA